MFPLQPDNEKITVVLPLSDALNRSLPGRTTYVFMATAAWYREKDAAEGLQQSTQGRHHCG